MTAQGPDHPRPAAGPRRGGARPSGPRGGSGGGAPGTAPRRAALALLTEVLGQGRLLADVLADAAGPLAGLAPAERARAQRLATQTLRHLGRADAVLAPLLRRQPPAALRDLLRLATVELLEEREAAHGPVNAAVEIAGGMGRGAQPGFVNAVLRRVAETPAEDWQKLPPQPLPGWLRGRLMAAFGKPAVMAMEAAHARGAPLDLTLRDPATAADWAARLNATLLPTGSLRLSSAHQARVSDLPGFAEGAWWVQDAAAALAVRALAPRPGERVLDLCAAPGGKTMQLAAAGAQVTALDISAPRMARVAENLARTGLAAAQVVADAFDHVPDALYDAVLLDAPCSATGTIRRHPDLPFVRQSDTLPALFALQARLIDRALALLAPGGRLVFCTCALLPEEGERQVSAALGRHPGLVADAAALALPGVDAAWITPQGGLRLRPDHWPEAGGMDGFFIAVLRRAAATPTG